MNNLISRFLKLTKYIKIPLLAFLLFTVLAIVTEGYLLSKKNGLESIDKFHTTFREKQELTQKILNELLVKLGDNDSLSRGSSFDKLSYLDDLFEKNEISFLVSDDNKPIYWTDNVSCFKEEIKRLDNGLVKLPNGWYFHTRTTSGTLSIDGLILIKYNYKIKNDYLRNRFANGFYFPRKFEVLETAVKGSYPVFDLANKYAFSIKPSGTINSKHKLLLIPGILYLLAFISFLIILYKINSHYFHQRIILKSAFLLIALMGIYTVMNVLRIPGSLYLTTLFSPQNFAFTAYWTSLGELLLFSSLLLFWSVIFNRTFDPGEPIKKNRPKRRAILIFCILFAALYFVFIRFMIYNLVMNSTISFALYRVEEITISTLYGYLAISFLVLSYLFISIKIVQVFRKQTKVAEYFLIVTAIFIVLSLIFYIADSSGACRLSIFFWLIFALIYFMNQKGVLSNRLMVNVIYTILLTLFVLINMNQFIRINENKVQESMALNLSEEHDPKAELFLLDIDSKLSTDKMLPILFNRHADGLKNYLTKKYFGGYFREYDLQVTPCENTDSLVVNPENITRPCISFFREMVEERGTPISGTHFYYMENPVGRITYFGQFEIITTEGAAANIFIELNSRMLSEGVGFPELLLPLSSIGNRLKDNFSYAKYNNGMLVDRGGEFSYALSSEAYRITDQTINFEEWGGYDHCLYNYNEGNLIIVSRRIARVSDYLISFPYIFVFFFMIALLLNFVSRPSLSFIKRGNTLQAKIQLSIIGVVFTSLFIVGTGTINYIISRYKTNHQKDLIDKIASVSVEIERLIEQANQLEQPEADYMNYELMRASEIFRTDINLFDLDGNLVATSRPEIFEKGLISDMMDHRAYRDMNLSHPASYLQQEHIGKLEFLSAYVPLINAVGSKIGYLNLPYFTREKEFRQEITTFILAFINIYIFLLLASILVAFFISSRISGPLKLIREHLQGIQLGKNPTPINYKANDEIGTLVNEYNQKVEELALSAELLARSERELAWREMARQIAHEIKNPLTPMKLNIQFLQRTDPKKVDNYDEIMNRVTTSIIEQIDNLSSIASEFSNFANIPRAKNEKFNLSKRIIEILSLFDYTGECEIETRFKGGETLQVYADKEQFSRAFINLIKNAIQAIPDGQKGKIIIEILNEGKNAQVKVSDNGRGIPDDLKDRIFVPNFTTKSSGTGLGLAITKSIVDNFNGEIWFHSEHEKGTTFFIRIPVIE